MVIRVKLYGMLRQYRPETAGGAPHHPFSVHIAENGSVLDLMALMGLPADLVTITAVNQNNTDNATQLNDGDQVSLFPPTAGGSDENSLNDVRHSAPTIGNTSIILTLL